MIGFDWRKSHTLELRERGGFWLSEFSESLDGSVLSPVAEQTGAAGTNAADHATAYAQLLTTSLKIFRCVHPGGTTYRGSRQLDD